MKGTRRTLAILASGIVLIAVSTPKVVAEGDPNLLWQAAFSSGWLALIGVAVFTAAGHLRTPRAGGWILVGIAVGSVPLALNWDDQEFLLADIGLAAIAISMLASVGWGAALLVRQLRHGEGTNAAASAGIGIVLSTTVALVVAQADVAEWLQWTAMGALFVVLVASGWTVGRRTALWLAFAVLPGALLSDFVLFGGLVEHDPDTYEPYPTILGLIVFPPLLLAALAAAAVPLCLGVVLRRLVNRNSVSAPETQ